MNKIYKALAISLAAIFSVNTAQAVEQVGPQDIGTVFVYGDSIVIGISGTTTNADSCTRNNSGPQNFLWLDIDSAAGKAMYASVLTAKASGSQASFGVNGCRQWGASTIPLIYRVDMR